METGLILLILLFVVTGSVVKGLTGFGFGILGTALLANFIPVQEAVTVMILPMLAVNIPLILDAEFAKLKECVRSYHYFLLTGITGSLAGVLLIEFLPLRLLSILIGFMAVLYVYFKQELIPRPERIFSRCLTRKWYNQILVGSLSGIAFGASNIGLLYVTYLDKIEIDRQTFAGLLSAVILSATAIRVLISWSTGLYTSDLLMISAGSAVLAVTVSALAAKAGQKVGEKYLHKITLIVILLAGTKILLGI